MYRRQTSKQRARRRATRERIERVTHAAAVTLYTMGAAALVAVAGYGLYTLAGLIA